MAVTWEPSSTPTTRLTQLSTLPAASQPALSALGGKHRRNVVNTMPASALPPGTLSGITYLISDQTSNYNGLQISATKQMSRGFTVSGFYVWSRALESAKFVENGAQTAQDFGYFGKPFTPSNNSMGALGGGLAGRIWPHE